MALVLEPLVRDRVVVATAEREKDGEAVEEFAGVAIS